jgi:hypothetical protein
MCKEKKWEKFNVKRKENQVDIRKEILIKLQAQKEKYTFYSLVILIRVIIGFTSLIASCCGIFFLSLTLEEIVGYTLKCSVGDSKGT